MSLIDDAGAIRAGEELNGPVIDAWLKSVLPDLQGSPVITQFPGGASNLTYRIRYDNRDLILRRPPFGKKAKGAHDMAREARIMQALKPVYPYVPEVLALCQDAAVMDADFYVMQRLVGIIPRKNFPDELILTPEQTRTLCRHVIDRLIELHQVDVKAAGLDSLGKGEGYVARQVSGWSERYRNARTPDVVDAEAVMAWLEVNQPPKEVAICLIHNDFRLDNVVLDAEDLMQVTGVLDWEMATLGDPLMDLGNTLAYWVQSDDDAVLQMMRRQPTNAAGMMTRAEVIAYYGEKTGWRVDDFTFYEVYGLFRLAAIAQQIYYRFYHGQTQNPQFAMFGQMVNYLDQRCQRLIAESSR
ncbi:phosphotransferase family protein [Pseudomonas sp.]|uniref:phosphotransferase family protein n=1 Tax=Pseudomonas sp. TaxID=306 RepID=UPI0027315788|nr:phosphotransferase family protein [Pseudomonas sp.]MDP2245758.1 phosphotransferase family protein [Pseudomonas sp.]